MRYYEIAQRRNHRLRPTASRGARGTWSTTQGKFRQAAEVRGYLITLPEPGHILLVRVVVMRPFLILVAMVVSGSRQAWGFMGEVPQTNRAGATAPAHRLYPHREGR
jgi:hypothetical protein